MSLEKPTLSAKVDPLVKVACEVMADRRGKRVGTWLKTIVHEELVMDVAKGMLDLVGFLETYQRLQRPSSFWEQGQLFELERTGGSMIPPMAATQSSWTAIEEHTLRDDIRRKLPAIGPVELCLRLTSPGHGSSRLLPALCAQCESALDDNAMPGESHGLLPSPKVTEDADRQPLDT